MKAMQQSLRAREQERREKVAYANHLQQVQAEQTGRRLQEKMTRAWQIEAEREQVLATMGRLRQEMSMQEDLYREALYNMKVPYVAIGFTINSRITKMRPRRFWFVTNRD